MYVLKSFTFWRIYILVVAIFIFLLAAIFFIAERNLPEISRAHFQEVTDAEVNHTAKVLSAMIEQYTITGDSIQQIVTEENLSGINEKVRRIVSISPLVDLGVVITPEGAVGFSYPYEYDRDLTEQIERLVQRTEVTVSSDFITGVESPIIGTTVPLYNGSNEIHHYIYLGSFTQENLVLDALLNQKNLGSGGYSAVVDQNGDVLAHALRERVGKNISDRPIVEKIMNKQSGYEHTINSEGNAYYASYQYIPELEWGIIAQIPESSIYDQLRDFRSSIWNMALFVIVSITFFTYIYARKTLEPFVNLYDAVDKVAEGNYTKTLDVNVKDYPEMKNLIVRFNEMVHNFNQSRKEVEYRANHDILTGLPNRYHIEQLLEQEIVTCDENDQSLALMFMDLDRFKILNDTMGHQIGDQLLIQTAIRLQQHVCENCTVGRLGGDEFLILSKDASIEKVSNIAKKILKDMANPFIINSKEFFTSPSIGISVYPKDGQTKDDIIKHADTAMYVAKENGGNNYQFYTPEPTNLLSKKYIIENDLRKALKNEEFLLYYQPQVDLKSGDLVGLEALIRWQHPKLGLIPPMDFIPIAEETGYINHIGKWLIKEACRQNKQWQQNGSFYIPVAVNVSPWQFRDKNFVENIKAALDETNLDPKYLELEITESMMHHFIDTIDKVHQVKEMGIKVAIDDFGTGYSSLNAIDQLPIDTLKIDRSFIRDMITNDSKAAIVKTIIDLGNNLHLNTIAEGVEYEEQATFLANQDCVKAQGYLFSKPLPPEQLG
ncbi:EAL domain-containing protein [Evansella cellulosilytica]|uniref:Diguanylate cyclase/phosphodiesterase with extracellular sensor n=1 Tax=Evansella cellulosilytica (strain ATCC 21833 / DSM 2522 / FERM P-1141 / JCM 9156 / N-4) TaxID=649639 RepID=E6TWF0_EVAC2|nr:EAL domain-containing protein [Evansella cellulosilytica]ADU32213.1 diguanylate cyclase/phosphodiesterase with extracellular sensor [Evansella cellulosilytica DSM 2522]